jgi:hypothetical protein
MASLSMRRLLWIVNHKTLLQAEVPILRSLGWEVFVPKILPEHDPGFRSAATSYEFDSALGLPPATLAVLNRHNFIERGWPPTVAEIVNSYFNVIVTHFSYYTISLSEAARKFHGTTIARAFGREHPRRFSEFATMAERPGLLDELMALGDRFVFGQGYDNIAEVEDPPLPQRAHHHCATAPIDIRLSRHLGGRRLRQGRLPLPEHRYRRRLLQRCICGHKV